MKICPVCSSKKVKYTKEKESVRIFKRPKFDYQIEICHCKKCGFNIVIDDAETQKAIDKAEQDFVLSFLKGLLKDWKTDKYTGLECLLKIPYGTIGNYIKAGKFSREFIALTKLFALHILYNTDFDQDDIFKKVIKFQHHKKATPIVYKKKNG